MFPYLNLKQASAAFFLLLCLTSSRCALAFEVHFTRVNTDAGLRTNFIQCIAQTSEGYIWIGTPNGLHRFDGNTFRQFKPGIRNRMPPLPVDEMLALSNGKQMLVRMGNLIGRFDTGNFSFDTTAIPIPRSQSPRHAYKMFRDRNGQVFLIVYGERILVYNAAKNVFETNRKIIDYPDNVKPTALQCDAAGNLWIGSHNGLGVFSPASGRHFTAADHSVFRPVLQKAAFIHSVTNFLIDHKNRIFIRSWPEARAAASIFLIDPERPKVKPLRDQPSKSSVYYELSVFEEKQNIIWGFGMDIFNLYDEEEGFTEFYNPENADYGINTRQIRQLFEDRDKNLWVATDNGLYTMTITGNHIRNGTLPNLKGANLTNLAVLDTNRLLFSTWGSGVSVLKYNADLQLEADRELEQNIYKNVPRGDQWFRYPWSICVTRRSKEVILGCQHGRMIYYDVEKKHSSFLNPDIFRESTIRTIAADAHDNLWFGTHSGLLIKQTGKYYTQIADLKHPIVKLHAGRAGRIWVATDGQGIFQFDSNTDRLVRQYTSKANGLSNDRISDLRMVNDSLLAVVCTANFDLLNVRTGVANTCNMYNGLPAGVVTSVQQDRQGNIWLSTFSGICKLDWKTNQFQLFDHSLGLARMVNSSNLMLNSVRLPGGQLAFSGEKNFVIFDPAKMTSSRPAPHVEITDFKLFNRSLPLDSLIREGKVELAHDQNFVSLDFTSFSYGSEPQPAYYYRLKGADEHWIRSDNSFTATFPSLEPGEYVFEIKTQNRYGQFSHQTTRLPIHIRAAFWQTWWFMAMLILMFVLPFYIFYLLRLKRLVAIQRIREGVARDLHDDMGSTLTSIAILSEVVSNTLPENQQKEREYVSRISASSSQMMDAMDDIVWSIKPDNDFLHRIVARMREYAASVLEPQGIVFSFEHEENDRMLKLRMDDRRNLFLIYKEALTNISKYAAATEVSISLLYQNGWIELRVADNGKGFDNSARSEGNGLANMKKRATLLSGHLSVTSKTSSGTVVFVRFLLKK